MSERLPSPSLGGTPRVQFTFCAVDLKLSDELIVKSLMRGISHLTTDDWRYEINAFVDLLLQGDQPDPLNVGSDPSKVLHRMTIKITRDGSGADGTLALPIRLPDLVKQLAWAGRKLNALRQVDAERQGAAPPGASGSPKTDGLVRYKLERWPGAQVLGQDPRYAKLSTLLLARALHPTELARKSRVDAIDCEVFIERLKVHGLLQTVHAQPPAPEPESAAPMDLVALAAMTPLERVMHQRAVLAARALAQAQDSEPMDYTAGLDRRSLAPDGDASAPGTGPSAMGRMGPNSAKPVPSGLFARLRARLGIN